MRQVIAIDFDGTVTEDARFPVIGKEQLWVVGRTAGLDDDDIKSITNDGVHVIEGGFIKAPATYIIKRMTSEYTIIFHTCRTGKPQEMMKKWLRDDAACKLYEGHDYEAVNRNSACPEAYEKLFADVYLDNRGLTWDKELNIEEAIRSLIKKLPIHTYIPLTEQ